MKKVKQISLTVIIALAMCFVVSACGAKEFDAAGYTKASLKASFHQDYEDYSTFRNLSKEDAKKEVENINRENILAQAEDLALTDEQKENFYQATMKCYSKAKFEVGEAKKESNGNFTVPVSYEPIDCFTRFVTDFEAACANRPEVLTDESKLSDFMIEFLAQCADEVTYGEKKTLDITIEKEGNVYQMAQGELEKIDVAFVGGN